MKVEKRLILNESKQPEEIRYYQDDILTARLGVLLDEQGRAIGLRELPVEEVIPQSWFSKLKHTIKPRIDISTIDFIGLINWIDTINTINTINEIVKITKIGAQGFAGANSDWTVLSSSAETTLIDLPNTKGRNIYLNFYADLVGTWFLVYIDGYETANKLRILGDSKFSVANLSTVLDKGLGGMVQITKNDVVGNKYAMSISIPFEWKSSLRITARLVPATSGSGLAALNYTQLY